MRRRQWVMSLVPTLAAAVLGNVFISRESLTWFKGLQRPAMQLPMAGFYALGAINYPLMGLIVHRAVVAQDRRTYRLAVIVLGCAELWTCCCSDAATLVQGFWALSPLRCRSGYCRRLSQVIEHRPSPWRRTRRGWSATTSPGPTNCGG